MGTLNWRKASRSSSSGGDCVEVADHCGTVLVRDTEQPAQALKLYEFIDAETRAGNKLLIRDEQGNDYVVKLLF